MRNLSPFVVYAVTISLIILMREMSGGATASVRMPINVNVLYARMNLIQSNTMTSRRG